MKKRLLSFGVGLMLCASLFAQTSVEKGAFVPVNSVINKNVPTLSLQSPDLEQFARKICNAIKMANYVE